MTTYAIRYPDDDPYGRGGAIVGDFPTRDEAEQVLRAMPSRVEIVEVDQ